METLKVLSIDIGITNLGFVYSRLDFYPPEPESRHKAKLKNDNYILNCDQIKKYIQILDCNRVDITKVHHNRVKFCNCKLHHDRCIPDYLDHFVQETYYFQECDVLLLERQPPTGITNVQDLLFKQFRHKAVLVHPSSMHSYFDLPGDYTLRKVKSEQLSCGYLAHSQNFLNNIRRHDISDAMLMTLFYYKTKMEKIIAETVFVSTSANNFEMFRFKKD
jgi:hypothetical protein